MTQTGNQHHSCPLHAIEKADHQYPQLNNNRFLFAAMGPSPPTSIQPSHEGLREVFTSLLAAPVTNAYQLTYLLIYLPNSAWT